jgi:Flp pilus assembly pilin Flp
MQRSFGRKVRALARDDHGLSTVEYVVLLVLVVAMAVAAWNTFGRDVKGKLGTAAKSFNASVVGGTVQAGGTSSAPTSSGARTIDAE